MAKRRTGRGAVVITVALASACAGTTPAQQEPTTTGESTQTGTQTAATNRENPPVPLAPSIVEVGGMVARRHGMCWSAGPAVDCTVPPCPAPPAQPVRCPEELVGEGRIRRDDFGACVFVEETCPPPMLVSCNPPPPQEVPCDRAAVESGLQTPGPDGRCRIHGHASCPPPHQPPCTDGASRPVPCPTR